MKKLTLCLTLLFVSTIGFADDGTGYFVGFDLGSAHINYQPNSFSAYTGLVPATEVSKTKGLASDVYIGYRLYRELGWQVGYMQFQSANFSYANASTSMIAKRHDYDFLIRGDYPFTSKLNGFVKLGMARINSRYEVSSANTSNVTAWSPIYGAGVSYSITDHLGVNTQWLHINKVKTNARSIGVDTPDVPATNYFSLGMLFRF